MTRQCCPFHADDDTVGVPLGAGGGQVFTCTRANGHPSTGAYTWYVAPEPPDRPGISGLAEQLGLQIELPAAVATYPGQWVEFGLVEAAYAAANPKDFATLVARYGHTAIKATRYSASVFLAATLGRLSTMGDVRCLACRGPRPDILNLEGGAINVSEVSEVQPGVSC